MEIVEYAKKMKAASITPVTGSGAYVGTGHPSAWSLNLYKADNGGFILNGPGGAIFASNVGDLTKAVTAYFEN